MASYDGDEESNMFGNFTNICIRPFARDPADNKNLSFVVLDRRPDESNKVLIFMTYCIDTDPDNGEQNVISAYDKTSGETLFVGELDEGNQGHSIQCYLDDQLVGEVSTEHGYAESEFINMTRHWSDERHILLIRPVEVAYETKSNSPTYGVFSSTESFLVTMHEDPELGNWTISLASDLEDEERVMVMLVALQIYVEEALVSNQVIPVASMFTKTPENMGSETVEPIKVLFLSKAQKVDIRGAGYMEQKGTTIYYFDVISENLNLVELTIECLFYQGGNVVIVARNRSKKKSFTVTDIFGNDMTVLVDNIPIGKFDVRNSRLVSRMNSNKFDLAFEKDECNTEKVSITHNSKFAGEINNDKGHTAQVAFKNSVSPLDKMCVFGFAMRHSLLNYRLGSIPMPLVNYKYNVPQIHQPVSKGVCGVVLPGIASRLGQI